MKKREARCSRADLEAGGLPPRVSGPGPGQGQAAGFTTRSETRGSWGSAVELRVFVERRPGQRGGRRVRRRLRRRDGVLASSLLKRSLEGALLKGSSANDLAAPLLNILDSGDKPDEPASAAVGALLAPLALQEKSPVLDALLARCGGNGGGLTALERVLDAAQKNGRRDIGGDAADALCREVASSNDAHRRDRASRLFAKIDADVALPRLRAALKRALKQKPRKRPSRHASALI